MWHETLGGQKRKGSEWWYEVGGEKCLRNGYREETGLPMTDTGNRETESGCETGS